MFIEVHETFPKMSLFDLLLISVYSLSCPFLSSVLFLNFLFHYHCNVMCCKAFSMEMILKLMNANAKVILILCRLFPFNEHFLVLTDWKLHCYCCVCGLFWPYFSVNITFQTSKFPKICPLLIMDLFTRLRWVASLSYAYMISFHSYYVFHVYATLSFVSTICFWSHAIYCKESFHIKHPLMSLLGLCTSLLVGTQRITAFKNFSMYHKQCLAISDRPQLHLHF